MGRQSLSRLLQVRFIIMVLESESIMPFNFYGAYFNIVLRHIIGLRFNYPFVLRTGPPPGTKPEPDPEPNPEPDPEPVDGFTKGLSFMPENCMIPCLTNRKTMLPSNER